jgi:hypothetical protein
VILILLGIFTCKTPQKASKTRIPISASPISFRGEGILCVILYIRYQKWGDAAALKSHILLRAAAISTNARGKRRRSPQRKAIHFVLTYL